MTRTIIGIGGMMCGMCEAHINDAIRRAFAVKSAKADRKRKRCVVLSDQPLDEDLLRKVIGETGYDLLSIESEPYQSRGFFAMR